MTLTDSAATSWNEWNECGSPCIRRSGIRRSGMRRSGMRRSGIRRSGIRRSGIRRSGIRRSGIRRSGIRRTGNAYRYYKFNTKFSFPCYEWCVNLFMMLQLKLRHYDTIMVYCICGFEVTLIIYDDNTLSNLVIFKT